MKCPKCEHNQRKVDGMTCGSCGYRFVLDPVLDKMADGRFLKAIDRASYSQTRHYTVNQLLTAYFSINQIPGCILFAICAAIMLLLGLGPTLALGDLIGFPAGYCGMLIGIAAVIIFLVHIFNGSAKELENALAKWQKDGHPETLEKLITAPALENPPAKTTETDLFNYGVERILIVDAPEIVDYFVLNNLHAEQRALIVSADGYPSYLWEQLPRLLQESPDTPIFLLHGSSPQAADAIKRGVSGLRQATRIIHLGLTKKDVTQLSRIHGWPRSTYGAFPVDALPIGSLSQLLTNALDKQAPISAVLLAAEPDDNFG